MSIRKSKNRQHNDQKKKVQKDKQRSTKYAHESKDPRKRQEWVHVPKS